MGLADPVIEALKDKIERWETGLPLDLVGEGYPRKAGHSGIGQIL
jgi:hypothetical protein